MRKLTAIFVLLFVSMIPLEAQTYYGQFGTLECDPNYQSCYVPQINACMASVLQNDGNGWMFAPFFLVELGSNFWGIILWIMDLLGIE